MIAAFDTLLDLTVRPDDGAETVSGACQQHGHFEAEAVWFAGKVRNTKPDCPVCTELAAEAIELVQQRERKRRLADSIDRRLRASGMPRRMIDNEAAYKPVTPRASENFEVTKQYATTFAHRSGALKTGACLVLCGNPGTGKTHLACRIGKYITERTQLIVKYATAADVSRSVRATYGDNDANEGDVIDQWAKCDLLILDELGVKNATDYDRSLLFEIIDKRYQERLPTVVISNLKIAEIGPATDERMMDRLRDNCTVLVFDWGSYRGSAA